MHPAPLQTATKGYRTVLRNVVVLASILGSAACGLPSAGSSGSAVIHDHEVPHAIVAEGKTEWAIVVPSQPSPAEQFSAEELARLIRQSTEAELPIIKESDSITSPALYVGRTAVANVGLALEKNIHPDGLFLRTHGEDLLLFGLKDRGTLYAVYRFAERFLGASWLDRDTELITEKSVLTVPSINLYEAPTFGNRWLLHGYWGAWSSPDFNRRETLFRLRIRDNEFYRLKEDPKFGGADRVAPEGKDVHNLPHYIIDPEVLWELPQNERLAKINAALDAMPSDFFATSKEGKPLRPAANGHLGQFNVMHPELRGLIRENLLTLIRRDQRQAVQAGLPPPTIYDLSLNDNFDVSHDPVTRAFVEKHGSESAPLIDFINELADAVAEEFPEVRVQTLAYMQSQLPPTSGLKPAANVVIRWCDWSMGAVSPTPDPEPWHPLTHPINAWRLQNLQAWGRLAALTVWDYGEPYTRANFPFTLVPNLKPDLTAFRDAGVVGVMIQNDSGAPWLDGHFSALYHWLAAQLMWDVEADEEALINRFMDGYYGPAAPTMRAFYDDLEKLMRQLPSRQESRGSLAAIQGLTREFLLTLDTRLQAAQDACEPGSPAALNVLRERLTFDKFMLDNEAVLARKFGPDDPFPFNREARISAFAEQSPVLLRGMKLSDRKTAEFTSAAERSLDVWRNPVDIPERFTHHPADQIVQFYWPDFEPYRTRVVEDAEAPSGRALRLNATDAETHARPPRFALYNRVNRQSGPGLNINRRELAGDSGYRWYRVGEWEIRPGTIVHSQHWELSVDLGKAFVPSELPETNRWEVWVSAKFTGPAYDPASQAKENGLYLERVVLVRPNRTTQP